MKEKTCSKCKIEQPVSNFNKCKAHKDGLKTQCRVCWKEYNKTWYKKNKDKSLVGNKKWCTNNKEQRTKYSSKYKKERRKNDPLFKLTCNLRNSIKGILKRNNHNKNGSKTEKILGCTFKDFKEYLESKFEPWMNWMNYGKHKKGVLNYGWDIDHIIPLASAKTEEELLKLCHYINLQPLCSHINRDIKKDKLKKINT